MRLLHAREFTFKVFAKTHPPYAILSHRWNDTESSQQDVERRSISNKIREFANYATSHLGLEWIWVDSCCINQASSAELSEGVNSMFEWYRDAKICIAYLADVEHPSDQVAFRKSVWFKRGWTLQELVASTGVVFVTGDWQVIGHKGQIDRREANLRSGPNLESLISEATGIPRAVLQDFSKSNDLPVSEKLRWMEGRETTKEEDMSYALFGIFGVAPGANYGEKGYNAKQRLLDAIQKKEWNVNPFRQPQQVAMLDQRFHPPIPDARDSTSRSRPSNAPSAEGPVPPPGWTPHAEGPGPPPGWTPLHTAVRSRNLKGIQAALASGANPNASTEDKGWTPLWYAAYRGDFQTCRMLVKAGANVNATTSEGVTALRDAAKMGSVQVVQLLLDNGADPDLAPYSLKDGPLLAAAMGNHNEIVKMLLRANANINAQNCVGSAALHFALYNGNEELSNLLIAEDADVNSATVAGLTPLYFAATHGFTDICSILIALGADINARNGDHNVNAISTAVYHGHLDCVKLLVTAGARIDICSPVPGYSMADAASVLGHREIYEYLAEV